LSETKKSSAKENKVKPFENCPRNTILAKRELGKYNVILNKC